MSLSGVASKGLVSGSVGRQFGRSTSCGDLTAVPAPPSAKDGIQLYMATPGASAPIRMLASDSISSVNLKIKAPPRGFYSRQQCIVSGSITYDDVLPKAVGSVDDRRFVMGLSDLLYLSVSTTSGKEYQFSSDGRSRASGIREDPIVEEDAVSASSHGAELSRVPSWTGSGQLDLASSERANVTHNRSLHLVANRSASKVYVRPVNKGRCLELSVHAAPKMPRASSCNFFEPPLLDDGDVPVQTNDCFSSLLKEVEEGLLGGAIPELAEEGSGGTYFMADRCGQKVAVFKPVDEEPLAMNCPRGMMHSSTGEGLKRGTRVGEGAFREVAAFLLDYPSAPSESDEGFSGVPRTLLSRFSEDFFHSAKQDTMDVFSSGMDVWKLGSLQEFVKATSNCEDMGPQRFPVHEVHKIAVLDMRLGNADRNGANILVQQAGSNMKLVPIDHGYCLPETLEDCTFEWLYWSQSKKPFDKETLNYIANLDAEKDIQLLRTRGWSVSEAVARTLRVCTMLLKKGASMGLTAYDIGSKMVRMDFDNPSVLEEMLEETEACVDREGLDSELFMAILSGVMDEQLRFSH